MSPTLDHSRLMLVDTSAAKKQATVILKTPFSEDNPELSPDGKWLAYVSDESGRTEVYVRPASGSFEQWPLSNGGGAQARWSRGGRELLYIGPDGNILAVAITTDPVFRPGAPKALFQLPEPPDRDTPIFEDVTADGERILLNVPTTCHRKTLVRLTSPCDDNHRNLLASFLYVLIVLLIRALRSRRDLCVYPQLEEQRRCPAAVM